MQPLSFFYSNGDNSKADKRFKGLWKRLYYNGVYLGKFKDKTPYLERYIKLIFPDGATLVEEKGKELYFEGPDIGEQETDYRHTQFLN